MQVRRAKSNRQSRMVLAKGWGGQGEQIGISVYLFFNILFIYSTERERAQAGGAAGRGKSREQGVQSGTSSQDPGIMPVVESRCLTY